MVGGGRGAGGREAEMVVMDHKYTPRLKEASGILHDVMSSVQRLAGMTSVGTGGNGGNGEEKTGTGGNDTTIRSEYSEHGGGQGEEGKTVDKSVGDLRLEISRAQKILKEVDDEEINPFAPKADEAYVRSNVRIERQIEC